MFQRLGPTRLGPPFSKVWQAWHCLAVCWPFSTRGRGKQGLDRHLRLLRCGLFPAALVLDGDLVAGLGRLLRRENGAGGDIERQHDQAGAKDGAEDFVEFERVHRKRAPGAGRLGCRRYRRCEVAGREIPACLASGNPSNPRNDVQSDHPHPGPHGFDPPARQAARRYRRRADDRARAARRRRPPMSARPWWRPIRRPSPRRWKKPAAARVDDADRPRLRLRPHL